jgi:hypothetical protein
MAIKCGYGIYQCYRIDVPLCPRKLERRILVHCVVRDTTTDDLENQRDVIVKPVIRPVQSRGAAMLPDDDRPPTRQCSPRCLRKTAQYCYIESFSRNQKERYLVVLIEYNMPLLCSYISRLYSSVLLLSGLLSENQRLSIYPR